MTQVDGHHLEKNLRLMESRGAFSLRKEPQEGMLTVIHRMTAWIEMKKLFLK